MSYNRPAGEGGVCSKIVLSQIVPVEINNPQYKCFVERVNHEHTRNLEQCPTIPANKLLIKTAHMNLFQKSHFL